jgi:hypothetical protein
MVSGTVLAGIFGFLGTLFLGFLYTTLWTWRHSASLGGEDEERVVELESHHKSQVDEELKEIFIEIDDFLDDPDDIPPDMKKGDHVANVIHRQIGSDDIEPIVTKLEDVDKPETLFDNVRDAYRSASRDFMWGGFATLGLSGSLALAIISSNSPFESMWPFLYFLLVILILNKGYNGVKRFLRAQSEKDEFEALWREYKRID